jgi:hypothetical protein
MRRRRLLLGTSSPALLGLVGGLLLLWYAARPSPGVTPSNFHRLRAGMTRRQVEAILGCPGVGGVALETGLLYAWGDSQVAIWVIFLDGRAVYGALMEGSFRTAAFGPAGAREEPLLDRLRRLLHL